MSVKINPAWIAWQNGVNEGGGGYNPHRKWIKADGVRKPATTTTDRMLRGVDGNLVPASKLAATLASDEARLAVITDATAREIIERRVAHARAQLGA